MGFTLGRSSRRELSGVHPDLVGVVELAITRTTIDFTVRDGIREQSEQAALVRRGVSRTMNSKHRRQSDGYGHAVDLVPWINGRPQWDWDAIYHIAEAVHQSATQLRVALRWGGVWDRPFLSLAGTAAGLEREVQAYGARRRAAGRDVFTDGPHYEIS